MEKNSFIVKSLLLIFFLVLSFVKVQEIISLKAGKCIILKEINKHYYLAKFVKTKI